MPKYLQKLKQYAGVFGTGMLHQMAPKIAGGIINELFHRWNVDVAKVTHDVQRNRSIWAELKPDQHRALQSVVQKTGNLDFLTPQLFIDSIKKDFPAVASLFLSWPEAMEWLERQIEELKTQMANH